MKNEEVIKSLEVGEELTLICEGVEFAQLTVEETFQIDKNERVKHIYGTDDLTHPGVQTTLKRLGSWAISGAYTLSNFFSKQKCLYDSRCKKHYKCKTYISSIYGS